MSARLTNHWTRAVIRDSSDTRRTAAITDLLAEHGFEVVVEQMNCETHALCYVVCDRPTQTPASSESAPDAQFAHCAPERRDSTPASLRAHLKDSRASLHDPVAFS